jgi:hypothetical protein
MAILHLTNKGSGGERDAVTRAAARGSPPPGEAGADARRGHAARRANPSGRSSTINADGPNSTR